MKKRFFHTTVHMLATLMLFVLSPDIFGEEKTAGKKVLILYQERIPEGVKYDTVTAIRNQISHFDTRIVELQSEKYKAGILYYYDVIFYLGIDKKNPPPESFYNDMLKEKSRTICWIYANIIPLTERADNLFGFKVAPREYGFNSISYKGFSSNRSGEDVFVINVIDRKKAKPYGALFRESEFVPYAVSSGNFWYICDLPFFLDSSSSVFCDLLHEIFKEKHQHYKYAMIRIEDIHPARNPKNLRRIGAVFKKYDIPFSFGVIPVHTHPSTKKTIFLSNKPHFASALRYLQSVGGTAILHGYTHQYKAESGEGHEFWDIEKDRPIAEDSDELIKERLNKGIEECITNGIYPLAWETPHYGASQLDYRVFSEIFSTGVERLQLSDLSFGASQSYPYFIKTKNGRWIVPENLGYVSYREGATVERMLEEAKKILVVRDAVAVGFFHPYIETEHLEKLIFGLKNLGYTFLDLRDIPNQVNADNWLLFSGLPYFHGEKFIHQIFYNWNLSPLYKIDLSSEYLYTFLLNRNFKKKDVNISKVPITGEVVLQIPNYTKSIFVIHKGPKPSVGWESFKQWGSDILFGKETVSITGTIMRLLMWFFFLITVALLITLVFIYLSFWFTGKKKRP